MPAYKRKNQEKGFTLLELILVMIIMCTLLAMASPSLRGFFSSRQINNAAEQILTITKYAKINSAATCSYYRVLIDDSEKQYWLETLKEGEYTRLENNFGRTFIIPSDITLKFEDVDRNGSYYYLEYDPQGRCKECKITLEDKQNNILELKCRSATEEFVLEKK